MAIILGYLLGSVSVIVSGPVSGFVTPWIPYRPLRVVFSTVTGGVCAVQFQIIPSESNSEIAILAVSGALAAAICSAWYEFAAPGFKRIKIAAWAFRSPAQRSTGTH